jgi:hypothetical protein
LIAKSKITPCAAQALRQITRCVFALWARGTTQPSIAYLGVLVVNNSFISRRAALALGHQEAVQVLQETKP